MGRPKKIVVEDMNTVSIPEMPIDVVEDSFLRKFLIYRERYKGMIAERAKFKELLMQHEKAVSSLAVSIKTKDGEIASLKGVMDKLIER